MTYLPEDTQTLPGEAHVPQVQSLLGLVWLCVLCVNSCFQGATILLQNCMLGYDISSLAIYGFGYKLEENFCSMDANILCFLKRCLIVLLWLKLWQFIDLSRSQARGLAHRRDRERRLLAESINRKAMQNCRSPQSLRIKCCGWSRPLCLWGCLPRAFPGERVHLGMGLAVDSLAPPLRSLTPLEHAPPALCPQGDSVVAAAHWVHREASDDLTFAVTPYECGALSPA